MSNDYEKQDIKMQNDEKQMSKFNIYFNKISKSQFNVDLFTCVKCYIFYLFNDINDF